MAIFLDKLPLRAATPDAWIPVVLADFPAFLQDHASCEKKAAANAMAFVGRWSDREVLVEPMICLAKEEFQHFHEVYRVLHKRGIPLGTTEKDPYVVGLLKQARHGDEEHFLDRLIIAALIEARSCERFCLLAEGLHDEDMKSFYARLAREEAGHHKIFLRIARHYFEEKEVETRLDQFLDIEAKVMLSTPLRAAVH
ncbi:MAG: tRNA-(ms[2]io[6]A)-hydroxylase [Proteobacteria bacterium]|nr:MAG: tRNA-(ms[2]io[6]A)-hydroxylase [Pseudomonadota bacterium]